MKENNKSKYFDIVAKNWDKWKKKNWYYHHLLAKEYSEIIPQGRSVLEVGCATGDLLDAVKPKYGVGIDISEAMLCIARKKYPQYKFLRSDIEDLNLDEKFDYVIISDLIGHLDDIYTAFKNLGNLVHGDSVVVINSYNFLWEPILKLGEFFGLRMHQRFQNWLSFEDIENLLYLAGFKVKVKKSLILVPKKIPFVSDKLNKHFTKIPILKEFNLVNFVTASLDTTNSPYNNLSCSVIVPCRNEAGNIKDCVERIPNLGSYTEIICVDGNSTDGTVELIEQMINEYKGKKHIKLIHQVSKNLNNHDKILTISKNKMLRLGKGDAVRKGFDIASGDILMILDADLSVLPEGLPKFYEVLSNRKAQFVNGSRLIYRPQSGAMNGIRFFGNRIFSRMFSYLLSQNITDTLCGTKALFKKDYESIKRYREFFGIFDPFGDFELLFTAAKGKLNIVDMPIRYQKRIYGISKVSVLKHGWLLLKMCFIGFLRFKIPLLRNKKLEGMDRKFLEIQHGKSIQDNAGKIWGWETKAGRLRVQRRINAIFKELGNADSLKILELGCGMGIFSEQFIKKGIDIISLDISYELIKLAKDKSKTNGFLVGDVEVLPFGDESFDLIIGVSILHHLDVKKALQEAKRVLKSGGKILLSEPNMANPQIFLQKRINWLKKLAKETPTETAFYRWKLKDTFQQCGFQQIVIFPFEFLHPRTPAFLINFVRNSERILEQLPVAKEIAGSLFIIAKK